MLAIDRIAEQTEPGDPQGLVDLVDLLRPRRADDSQQAAAAIDALIALLEADAARRAVLGRYIEQLGEQRQHRYLYTDTGIVTAEGLRRGTLSRLTAKWLPQAPHRSYLRDLFKQVFARADDYRWVQAIPVERWQRLWQQLRSTSQQAAKLASAGIGSAEIVSTGITRAASGPAGIAPAEWAPAAASASPTAVSASPTIAPAPSSQPRRAQPASHWLIEISEAINILAARLYASATNNEVVRLHQDESYSVDCFDRLGGQARSYRDLLVGGADAASWSGQQAALMRAIGECEKELTQWRRLLRSRGTTTSLSQQMLADSQMLTRMRSLAMILGPQSANDRLPRAIRLYRRLIEEQSRDSSVRDLWRRTNRMLASQVTEHAGMIGEHYVAVTRSAWFGMVKAASGAGLLVGLMALVKQLIGTLHLPPLWNALAISLNYATGFVVVHLLHLAIATKQPAMTAALIASTVQSSPSGKRSLTNLAGLIVAILRTQLIAIVCNVATALPMGIAMHQVMAWLLGPDWLPAAKAEPILADIDPVHSLALPHAAIAGVFLYLSGVLAGYYNNLCAVTQVPERLNRAGWLGWLGNRRRQRLSEYIRNNLGSLVGNASLGFMLGMAGFVGLLTGLPIDVRHVTLSAANFGFALPAMGWVSTATEIAWIIAGIMMIGAINLSVSFTLALWTAFSANGIRLRDGSHLWTLFWRRIRRRPSSLLLP